jgi:SUKH-4 immunity protein
VAVDTPPSWPAQTGSLRRSQARTELAQSLSRLYGPSFSPWPRDTLLGFEMPERVRELLTRWGLPLDSRLPLVRFQGPPLHWRREGAHRLLLLGNDEGAELRMREGSAEIVAAVPFRAEAPRFVNTTVLELLECLRRYADRREDLGRADEEGALNIASDLREGIASVDPRAVEHHETWWSRVLDRVEAGFEEG